MKPLFIPALVAFLISSAALAEDIAPFAYVDTSPPALLLNGVIDMRTPLAFRRAMKAHPDARVLALNSIGGAVQGGLLVAEEVHENGFQTVVPDRGECASACAFIFFAGKDRLAVGKLGVHQIFGAGNEQDTQTNLSDVVDALTRYGVDNAVLTTMLRTPSNQMHYFSADEISRLGINRMAEDNKRQTDASSEASRPAQSSIPVEDGETVLSLPLQGPFPRDKPVHAERQASGQAVDVAVAFLRAAQLSATEAERAARRAYGTTVLVDGSVVSREVLALRLKQHALEWPDRRIVIDLPSVRQSCSGKICDVEGRYEYFQADGKRRPIHGFAAFTLEVEMWGNTIVTHNEIRNRLR